MLLDEIKAKTKELEPDLIEVRHDLHSHPELGFQETRTATLVADRLEEAGLCVQREVAKTGVVAMLEGVGDKCFAMRGDMDALPIQEEADVPYKSQVPGVMHACGHDVHTTVVLGAALVLQQLKDQIPGQVKFIFQPAEETVGGAAPMIEAGVLENPTPDGACTIHTDGSYAWDTIGLRYGENLAAADVVTIEVNGHGVHGAMPHEGRDPIVASAAVILALQQLVSRRVDPTDPAVVSLGLIEGGTAFNIIPPKVTIKGTVRALNESVRKQIEVLLSDVAEKTAAAYGCEAKVEYIHGCPPLISDNDLTALAEDAVKKALGDEHVALREKPIMGGEDFSYFAERVPATQIILGIKSSADDPKVSFHDPRFVADDRCVATGVVAMCATAVEFLTSRA